MMTMMDVMAGAIRCAFLVAGSASLAMSQGHASQEGGALDGVHLPPLRVPIHAPSGDAAHAAERWAAGADYKVSFHDGFEFVPVRGPAATTSGALRWITEAVSFGARDLLDDGDPVRHAHGEWRYEYQSGAVTEAYDVHAHGVEQSFVIERPLVGDFDLRVCGRFDTDLRGVADSEASHTSLTFCDADGAPVVRYGAAFVLDATGAKLPIETRLLGDRATLIVPASWLARARYPVTIDPLISGVTVRNEGNTLTSTAVARADGASSDGLMVAYLRFNSILDRGDLVVLVCDADFSNPAVVFADLTSTIYDSVDVAFVGGPARWAVVYSGPASSQIGAYLHDRGNRTLHSGVNVPLGLATTANQSPRIGGATTGDLAMVVYQSGFLQTEVDAVTLDARARTFGTPARLSANGLDASRPAISHDAGTAGSGWIVAYQGVTRGVAGDDHDVYVTRATPGALGAIPSFVVGPDVSTPAHKITPQVSGRDGRYLVTMLLSAVPSNGEGQVVAQRFDWSSALPLPSLGVVRTLSTIVHRHARIAFDSVSRSHWCVASESVGQQSDSFWRLGFAGVPTESVFSLGASPSVAFDPSGDEFSIVYHVSGVVFGARLRYPSDAVSVAYGAGCARPSYGVSGARPFGGSEFFEVSFVGPPSGTSCAMLLSFGAASVALDSLGMAGCRLLVDTAPGQLLATLPIVSGPGAVARARFLLQNAPPFVGDLFVQWLWLEPGVTALGVGASHGLRVQVR